MELYDLVLFLHLGVLLCAIALAGVLHASEWLLPRARSVAELRLISRPQSWGVLFAPIVAALLLLGMWLVKLSEDQDATYQLSDGWVWTAVVVLAILFISGAGIMGRHATQLAKVLDEAPDGPVTPDLRALATNPVPWVVGHANTFMAVAVVSNMVNKPGAAISALVIVGGTLIGAALGLAGMRRARGAWQLAPAA
jgi:hypothetical protein